MISINKKLKKKILFANKYNYIYADFTGSGQASPIIEYYIYKNILPYYANIHSNSFFSKKMSKYIKYTKDYIKNYMNVSNDQVIIFTGNGSTGSFNHIIRSIDYNNYEKINIIISIYEHHSNFLPWKELKKKYDNINIYIIPLKDDGILDYDWFKELLLKLNKNDLNITSLTSCSNLTGIITDIKLIKNYIKTILGNDALFFIDYACLSPYKIIDASLSDVSCLSMHKYIGGISTPGILIADKKIFTKNHPLFPGGGCVKHADDTIIIYENEYA